MQPYEQNSDALNRIKRLLTLTKINFEARPTQISDDVKKFWFTLSGLGLVLNRLSNLKRENFRQQHDLTLDKSIPGKKNASGCKKSFER